MDIRGGGGGTMFAPFLNVQMSIRFIRNRIKKKKSEYGSGVLDPAFFFKLSEY